MMRRAVYKYRQPLVGGATLYVAYDDDGRILDVAKVEPWEHDCHAVVALGRLVYGDDFDRLTNGDNLDRPHLVLVP